MASGTLGDSNEDINSERRFRWPENRKVYTRRIHKKVQKACNGNGTSAATISVAENPSSAALINSAHVSPIRKEYSSAAVSSGAPVEASTGSVSEEPNHYAAASPLPTTNGSILETVASERTDGDDVVPESLKTVSTEDVSDKSLQHHEENLLPMKDGDSTYQKLQECKSLQHQEESLLRSSLEEDGDSTYQKLQEKRNQEQLLLPSEDNNYYSTLSGVQEGSDGQDGGHQNLENSHLNVESQSSQNSLLPKSNGAQNLQIPLPHQSENDNEMLLVHEDRTENLRDKSHLSHESDVPNGEVAASKLPNGDEAQKDGDQMPGSPQVHQGNGPVNVNGVVRPLVVSRIDDRIRFNLCKATAKNDIRSFRNQLECELEEVRRLFIELDSKEHQVAAYSTQISNSNVCNIVPEGADIAGYSYPQPQHTLNNSVDRRYLLKMNPEVSNMGHEETRPTSLARVNSDMGVPRHLEPRPYSRQLSIAVMENNHPTSEFLEKEKRTPKANQYYRNSEFLLGKDRLPSESNKRLKTNSGRKQNGESAHSFSFGFDKNRNQVFKSCSSLLQRMMKHKYGWVFNEPVDAKALGLFDYHDIIKHPMDLGTIKTRLAQNWYKSPGEFAEDVRLVFHNAMTYNPKGQDVHVMAEQLLQIFEERWVIIETEYTRAMKYHMYSDGGLPTPTSRKVAPQSHFTSAVVAAPPNPSFIPPSMHAPAYVPAHTPAGPQMRNFERPETTTMAVDPKIHRPHVGRTPVPKKPKAKDPNKRDMTYEEKQRLSTNLQGLPPEKLDAIVQIIKKRNTALSQHDDEIEVDIDRVDPETLWELDRFVTNYKKSLSKNKRKAELALQARMAANQNNLLTNSTPATAETQIRSGADKSIAPADGENQGYDRSRSSSSSSSSSDSGSSSTDSDSDSSSADGSDGGQSPRT